ncbi:type VII secretion protein EccE [Amycolatopsis taiwanensis]|uniref:Type VII secretion system protein EccE domain-containing protein n=1 Tax=Amycolatopsis taiwanensis TaxID=342230 RepID=A0A9W6R205_9PSEU|nr:type VII secretion protein EccE [Amycolatopsis taiwanensis]GLY66197.1 hypothetical protein Atai01_28160 [Amycolatopsis taiwanensis]
MRPRRCPPNRLASPLPGGFAQIAAWEVAAIPLSLHWCDRLARIAVAGVAALLGGTASVRVAGRRPFGWVFTWISYRLLQHRAHATGVDPLRALAHDFRLRQDVDRTGNQFGVAGVGDGWSAVIRMSGDPPVRTLLAALRVACADDEIPLAGAQLVIRSDGAERVHLLAVRYRPGQAPLAAVVRGGGEAGELRATTRAAQALLATLAESGQCGHLLEVGELATELRAALGAHVAGPSATDGWSWWSAGGTTQASFAARGRPDPECTLAARSPTASATVSSYTLWRTDSGKLQEELTIRLVKRQTPRFAPRAREVDVTVFPLYGRQASGVRRTLPLALPR